MKQIMELIQHMGASELQELIPVIQKRYSQICPGWDVVYLAVPKAPECRKQCFRDLLQMMEQDLTWRQGQP